MEHTIRAKALLFDLDGTLINSLPAVERAWRTFATHHGLDPDSIMAKIHGRRSIDSIRNLLPNVNHEEEDLFIRSLESKDTVGVHALPGAVEFLQRLPQNRWAIVTSGTSDVAKARCLAAGLPEAGAYVFGEDVINGKPAPDPFLLASAKLGVLPSECIGFEDTVAGLASIAAAGMVSIGIGLSNEISVRDLRQVGLTVRGDFLELSFSQ